MQVIFIYFGEKSMKIIQHRRAGMLITRCVSLLGGTNEKILRHYGLTQVSWTVLNKISQQPGQSTHALAEMCLLTDQSLGQIVAKLAKQGLVERTPTFGRAIVHKVTEKGARALAELEPLLDASVENFFSDLDKRELVELADLLERIVLAKGNERVKQSVMEFKRERKA